MNGAFPDEETSTILDLLALGRKKSYWMPDASTLASTQNNQPFDESSIRDAPGSSGSPINTYDQRYAYEGDLRNVSSGIQYTPETPQLIQDTSGHSHYIGPSGSLAFFAELRQLVSEKQPTSRFAADNLAEALEARPEPDTANSVSQHNSIPSPTALSSPIEALYSGSPLQNLPLDVLENLLCLYFDQVHPDFPLFHRAMFLNDFEQHFVARMRSKQASNSEIRNDKSAELDDGWLICLHMIIVFGCILQRSLTTNHAQINYESLQIECWNISRAGLVRLTTMCVPSHVQALLLMSLYLHGINERNASWVLVGCAVRIGVAIGLHRTDLHSSFSLIERETRKRIWCTLYGFEQFLCLSLGRPSAIDDEEVKARAPSDEIMTSSSGAPGCAEYAFKLDCLSSELRKTMSIHYRMTDTSGTNVKTTPNMILDKLSLWERELPPHLILPNALFEHQIPFEPQILQYCGRYPANHIRAIISLHTQYHSLVLLATRPYLLMVISSSSKSPGTTPYPWDETTSTSQNSSNQVAAFARKCVSSACRIATLTLLLDRLRQLNGSTWLDVYHSYSAAMVLLLRILWVPHHNMGRSKLEKEMSFREEAIHLVAEIRQAHKRITKSSTMRRFASVVENFADVVANAALPSIQVEKSNHDVGIYHLHRPENSAYPTEIGVHMPESTVMTSEGYHTANNHELYRNEEHMALLPSGETMVSREYIAEDPLTEAARVISSFSDENVTTESVLWNDPLQSVTQHIMDWNDFENFLGNLGGN